MDHLLSLVPKEYRNRAVLWRHLATALPTGAKYGEVVAPDLVIFDCDGVLVDTERIAVPIDALLLTELGWPMTEAEVVERFLGRSEADCTEDIERHLGRAVPHEVMQGYDHLYREAFERGLQPVGGVEAVLDLLERRGVRTCVASSGTHERIRFTLGLTGLLSRFEERMFRADDVDRGKPDPDLVLHAATRLGVSPARCAVIEDSRYGIEAALAAGMAAYGFSSGLTPEHRLAVAGGQLFADMAELPALSVSDLSEFASEYPRRP